ncbi:MAG: M48 family metalloprotease [Gallionellaceae bacterium]|nr:M48 family metalloprotease [Gallionellaceae bacterium]
MKKLLLPLLCSLTLTCYADGLPDLGDVSQEAISPQQERMIGEQSMYQIRANKSYLDDAEIADYLNQLGGTLIANSGEPTQAYEFFAINDNAINAFAMPGGFIGVNTGLILLAQNESELASVLSHEVAHVTQHHLARMVSGQKYDTLAAMAAIAVAIIAARDNPQAATAAIYGAQGGAMQRQLNFTRTYEQEADRIGLSTLQKSGFDTRAMPAFFEKMQRATRIAEGNTPTYLRTHPVTAERIADVGNRVQQHPFHLVPDRFNFQLVRAKLNANTKTPSEAVSFFTAALGEQKFGNPIANRYGLVLALLRNNQTQKAEQEFAALQQQAPTNAMITTLAGKLKRTNLQDKNIANFYRTATQNFPQHRALIYDYAEVLMQERRFEETLKLLNEQIIAHPNDAKLYELQARTFSILGRKQEEHHALAYNYILHGNLRGSIEQLELAKQMGTDYYELSTIETELKQFKEIAAAQRRKN